MTTKNSRVLNCRVSLDVYESFLMMAKDKGFGTPGEYLKDIVTKGLAKHFATGIAPSNGEGTIPTTRRVPLTQGAVWWKPGVEYAPGQKVLRKVGNRISEVTVPELDADGRPIPAGIAG